MIPIYQGNLEKLATQEKNNEDNFRNDDKKRCRFTIMLLLLLMIPPLRGRSARWQKLIVNREMIILLISETGDSDGTPERASDIWFHTVVKIIFIWADSSHPQNWDMIVIMNISRLITFLVMLD